MVHAISLPPGHFGGSDIDALFLGRLDPARDPSYAEIATLRVSAHFLVDRGGGVTQYVPVLRRAWHAGVSRWQGREACNDFSVGVELEGDDRTPFAAVQYERLVALIRAIQAGLGDRGMTGLTDENIVGHEHVAPGRKWDPGAHFDWERLRSLLAGVRSAGDWPLVWA